MKTQATFLNARKWPLGALAAMAFGTAPFAIAGAGTAEPSIPAAVRLASWQDNGQSGRYVLQLAQGRSLPAGERVAGIVTSDSNCEADAQGLSHCHNAIDLANGSRIVVINTHQMSRNRCLGTGDRVSLTGAGTSWVLGTLE